MEGNGKKGIIDAGNRILRELIKSPKFKKSMQVILKDIDPENTPALVRTFMTEDPSFFMDVQTALPPAINVFSEGGAEVLSRLLDYPPEMFAEFAKNLVDDIDGEPIGRAAGAMIALGMKMAGDKGLHNSLKKLADDLEGGLGDELDVRGIREKDVAESVLQWSCYAAEKFVAKVNKKLSKKKSKKGKMIKETVSKMADIIRDNPYFVREVMMPLIDAGRDALEKSEASEGKDDAK